MRYLSMIRIDEKSGQAPSPQLMEDMRNQAKRFGAEIVNGYVHAVKLTQKPFRVYYADQEVEAKTVVISTGSSAKLIGIESEIQLMGHGVSTCATCDGFFFRGKEIAVVGGGDSAMEEATFLTRFGESVTIVHRRDEFRASKIMAERALSNPKITVRWNSVVTGIHGEDGRVVGVRLRDTTTGAESTLETSAVFVAIGHDPRSDLFRGQIELDDNGYVLVDAPSTRTSQPGVFAAGDLVDHTYQQAITAAGTGSAAALDAERYIAALEH